MAIRYRWGPEAELVYQAANQAGQGRHRQNQDRLEEQQRQFDVVQDLRERQFGEQQRQFDEAQQFRRAGLASQISQQRQNRLFASQQQAGRMFENERRLQLGAAMEAQRNEARLLEQQMQDEARLAAEAMQTDRAQQERAYKQFAVQQGWMKADAQFVDEEVNEALDPILQEQGNLNEVGRRKLGRFQEELRQIQRLRGTALRDNQYVYAVNDWLRRFEAERIGMDIEKPPTASQLAEEQSFFDERTGQVMYMEGNGRWKPVDPTKDKEPVQESPRNNKKVFSDEWKESYKRLQDRAQDRHDRAYAEYTMKSQLKDAEGNPMYKDLSPPQLAEPSDQDVLQDIDRRQRAFEAYQAGEWEASEPVTPEPQGQEMPVGTESNPATPPPDMPAEQVVQAFAGQFIVAPDTGRVMYIPPRPQEAEQQGPRQMHWAEALAPLAWPPAALSNAYDTYQRITQ